MIVLKCRCLFLMMVLTCLSAAVSFADDVYMKDGRIYKHVERLRDVGDLFLFNYNNRNYSINKYRIDKIVGSNGQIVFEHFNLTAKKDKQQVKVESFVFYCNDDEVGSGKWDGNGFFDLRGRDMPDGVYTQYFDSGTVERTFTVKDGALNGPCRVFFESGIIQREGNFVDGKEQGTSKLFYKNGRLKGESVFVDGSKNGETKLFYDSGQVKAVMKFKNGQPEGEQKTYYESGALETVVSFQHGARSGPIKSYYESGKLKMEGAFKDGQLDGTVTTYYESGRVKKRKTFYRGRIMQ